MSNGSSPRPGMEGRFFFCVGSMVLLLVAGTLGETASAMFSNKELLTAT